VRQKSNQFFAVFWLCDCFDVLKHAKIARWHYCNADNLKTLKANYVLVTLLCAYSMTKYVGKNFALKFQAIAEKTATNLRGLLFATPCIQLKYIRTLLDTPVGLQQAAIWFRALDFSSERCAFAVAKGTVSQLKFQHKMNLYHSRAT